MQAEAVVAQQSPVTSETAAQLAESRRVETRLKRRRDDLVRRGLDCLGDEDSDDDDGGDVVSELLDVEWDDLDPADPAGALEILRLRLQQLVARNATRAADRRSDN